MADLERAVAADLNRFPVSRLAPFAGSLFAILFFIWANGQVETSPWGLIDGVPHMARIVGEMLPPDVSRIAPVGRAILETFLMAIVGTVYGVLGGFGLSIFAARQLGVHPLLYGLARSLIALFRTVPDLIWALFFVVSVGLGPFAGTLTIVVDTIGFCGRFFAEAMEEVEKGPQEALTAIGASRIGIIFSVVVPTALPSFVNTTLFSLEKAVRSSVILGLVGAGGVGIELKVAMDLFEYRQATTIIALVFLMVVLVERLSSMIRQRYL